MRILITVFIIITGCTTATDKQKEAIECCKHRGGVK